MKGMNGKLKLTTKDRNMLTALRITVDDEPVFSDQQVAKIAQNMNFEDRSKRDCIRADRAESVAFQYQEMFLEEHAAKEAAEKKTLIVFGFLMLAVVVVIGEGGCIWWIAR